jgi:hypothetical protein
MSARCEHCGGALEGRRADGRYFSSACRQAAYRARRSGVTASAPVRVTATASSRVTASEPAYLGGPCTDTLRCAHSLRFPNGPWTCEACHPRGSPFAPLTLRSNGTRARAMTGPRQRSHSTTAAAPHGHSRNTTRDTAAPRAQAAHEHLTARERSLRADTPRTTTQRALAVIRAALYTTPRNTEQGRSVRFLHARPNPDFCTPTRGRVQSYTRRGAWRP